MSINQLTNSGFVAPGRMGNIDIPSSIWRDPVSGSVSVKAGYKWLQEHATSCMFPDILGRTFLHEVTDLYNQGATDLMAVNKYVGFRLVSDFKALKVHGRSSLAGLLNVLENGQLIDDQRYCKPSWDIFTLMKGRAFKVAWQAIIDDDIGYLMEIPRDMAQAALEEKTRMAAAIFALNPNVGIANPCGGSADANAMWSAAHQNLGNTPLTGINLASALAIAHLFDYIARQKDPQVDAQSDLRGRPGGYRGRFVVTPGGQIERWVKVLVSAEMVSNALGLMVTNPLYGLGLEQVTNPYLTGSNYYMFADASRVNPAFVFADLKDYATPSAGAQPVMLQSAPSWTRISGGQFATGREDFHFDIQYGVVLFSNIQPQIWYGTAAYWTAENPEPEMDEDDSGFYGREQG